LGRAGVGKVIIIDPEVFEDSNLERVHGSVYNDIAIKTPKVVIAGRHLKSINPKCKVILIKGRIPQEAVINELLKCDIVLGCTDLHSARVALSDISLRYLIPVIDVGVVMEGRQGTITGQVVQINRLFPNDPCVYCRNMINSKIVKQELMSPEEQKEHINEAEKAKREGRDPRLYWIDVPQLNTVGYLTTLAGSMLVSYTVGYLTGRFKMVANRIELNLSPQGIQVVESNEIYDPECRCGSNAGVADQNALAIMSSAPAHWPKPELINLAGS
jgi:molybdopterin-synthase adenylyltransferase